METKDLEQCVYFLDSRIKSTNKIIEHLNEAKNTRMATDFVYKELDIQHGELDFFHRIIEYLKSIKEEKECTFKLSGNNLISLINKTIKEQDRTEV